MTVIKEGTDYGFNQTHHTGNRRHGDGHGRSAARVCSADWKRRSCQVLLRKRSRSHPLWKAVSSMPPLFNGSQSPPPPLSVSGGGAEHSNKEGIELTAFHFTLRAIRRSAQRPPD